MKKAERSYNLDFIRIFSLFTVICVHFFLNCGYYNVLVSGGYMFIMTFLRTFFMICVPLFITLSGYLMKDKVLSKKYYKGIVKTISIYFITSAFCIVFKVLYQKMPMDIKGIVKSVFDYTGASYGWYIEMYIGLFLIIPFLNLCYNGLNTQKQKLALLATSIFVTILPPFINVYVKILPSWWSAVYPVAYYFLGCYLKEYPLKLKKSMSLFLIFDITLLCALASYLYSKDNVFQWASFQDHGTAGVFLNTALVFSLLIRTKTDNLAPFFKKSLASISGLTLGAYLISYIFDSVFYPILNEKTPFEQRLYCFIPITLAVFICSLALSYVADLIYRFGNAVFPKMEKKKEKIVK
ncbi:MAG: acyltransferase family protein [Clostridia bacterium]|nr:acyltransferase family protein [Clostridia bacterium]